VTPKGADNDTLELQRSADSRSGMVFVPGGTFRMGSDKHYPEEAPAHGVTVGGFWIGRTPVTNREFFRFVSATGYVTLAEQKPDARDSRMSLRYLAGPLVGICVLICSSAVHAAGDCILPSSGYEHYDCNQTSRHIPEVKPDAKHCVIVYRSGSPERVCYPPKRR